VPGAFTVVLFGVVVAVLLVRPQGLMGRVAARSEAA
jgi:branched-subunit amino acid ABC-type transport system permease component